MKKAVCVLILTTFATPAFAGDLRTSMKRAVAEAAQASVPKPAPTKNPYLAAAGALVLGGGVIAVYGFTHTTGVEVGSNTTGTSVSAKETHNTTLGVIGLGIAAVGGVLFSVGQKKVSPQVSFTPRGASISSRWSW